MIFAKNKEFTKIASNFTATERFVHNIHGGFDIYNGVCDVIAEMYGAINGWFTHFESVSEMQLTEEAIKYLFKELL